MTRMLFPSFFFLLLGTTSMALGKKFRRNRGSENWKYLEFSNKNVQCSIHDWKAESLGSLLNGCWCTLLLSLSSYVGLKFSHLHREKLSHSCLCTLGTTSYARAWINSQTCFRSRPCLKFSGEGSLVASLPGDLRWPHGKTFSTCSLQWKTVHQFPYLDANTVAAIKRQSWKKINPIPPLQSGP